MGTAGSTSSIAYLERPGGRIAYEVAGEGQLAICLPGMGDLRSVYRFLTPALTKAGFRVAAMDLRGHGDSDATFDAYDDVAAGTDLVALAEHLGGPAVLVGNSMGAGAATWAAAERPDLVAGLVLIGPFVRNAPVGRAALLAFRLSLLKPWGPAALNTYYASMYPGRRPADLDQHRARIRESLRRPGHWRAFVATTHTSHEPVETRLNEVHAPTLVVMGERDRDFPDPAAEARLIADRFDAGGPSGNGPSAEGPSAGEPGDLQNAGGPSGGRLSANGQAANGPNAEVVMVPGAGHYPQAEYPEIVAPAVTRFLRRVFAPDTRTAAAN